MKKSFPPEEKDYTYFQLNRGDDTGSIWSSMCLDFQINLGTMRVSPRMKVNASATDDADLGLPIAFMWAFDKYWAICGAKMFVTAGSASPNTAFIEDTTTGVPTNFTVAGDLAIFDDRLWATTNNALFSKTSSGDWTSRDTISTVNNAPMAFFQNVPGGRLYYVGDSQEVWSIDAANVVADSGDYSIDLDELVSCMRATTDSIWIGIDTSGEDHGNQLILQWDGISAQLTDTFEVKGASKIQSLVILNDIPYAMDSNGILSKYTGYSFEEVGRLPLNAFKPRTTFVRMNGMTTTKNGTILIAVNNTSINEAVGSTASYYENAPSGIWEWSEQFGMVHKYAPGYTTNASSTITDFGQNRVASIGAIYNAQPFLVGTSGENGTLLLGATMYTNASSTLNAILYDDSNDTLQKKGYFVTTWFNSDEIQDKWERLWASYRRFLASTSSITFKYRLYEEEPAYATITWVDTTHFTTSTDITAYGPTATGFNGTQGGEVEVIQGTGSGSCVHITDIVNNAGTYTVTIDTAVTGVTTGTAKARFQKWILLNPKQAQEQVNSYSQYGIGGSNNRIQFKGCMTFTGAGEFFKMDVISNEDIKAT